MPKPTWFDWLTAIQWTALATVVIAVATLVNLGVAIFQWRATQDMLEEAKQSNQRAQRAWVIPRGIKIAKVHDPLASPEIRKLEPWALRITVDNTGHSPATITAYAVKALRVPPTDKCPPVELEGRKELTMFAIPQKDAYFTISGGLVIMMLDQVLRNYGGHDLSVYGIVYYTDIFKKTNATRFCYFLMPHIDASNAILPEGSKESAFAQCPACNSME